MIKKCLFPVAGYGTRFLPATKSMPKEMLPIVNKPLVQYGVEEAAQAGLTEIGFVTGRGKRAIADHFDVSYELEAEIKGTSKEPLLESINSLIDNNDFSFTRQNHRRGLGHAVLSGKNLIGNEPFAVVLADDLCINEPKGVLAQMVELFEQYPDCTIIAVQEVPGDQVHKYGIVKVTEIGGGLYTVYDMVEKPTQEDAPSNLAIIGRYILTPDIFDIIEKTPPGKGGEVQLTDAIAQHAATGRVLAYKFEGKRFDCGSIEGFVDATNYVYENVYLKNT